MNDNNRNEKLFQEFPPISTAAWEEKILEDLKGADYEKKLIWKTYEGIKVKPYYREEDSRNLAEMGGLPGQYPFIRGYSPQSNRWEIREEISHPDPSGANRMALHALDSGADAIVFRVKELAFREELNTLLRGIDLTRNTVHFSSSFSYSILADLLSENVKALGLNPGDVKGSFNFDSLSYYLLHGEFYNSAMDNFNEAAALLRFASEKLPAFRIIGVNGQYFSNAGATAVQELAYVLASASEYLAQLTERGLDPDTICNRIQLHFSIGPNYFMEIAKLRAARLLWAKLAGKYGACSAEALRACIHSISGLRNKTLYDPYVNMLRLTTEGMSAAIGGAGAITLLPFNGIYTENDPFGHRMARNVQNILKEESHLDKMVDPAGGSYYLESLTHEMASMAWEIFRQIESQGGMLKALTSGMIKSEIEKISAIRQNDVAQRKTSILGTNSYPNLNEEILDQAGDPELVKCAGNYLKICRDAMEFEHLRLSTEKGIKKGISRPAVFLATYGNLAMRKARAGFTTNFFGCAGYQILPEYLHKYDDQTVDDVVSSGAGIAVICSSDDEYAGTAVSLATALKQKAPAVKVVIAGYPKDIAGELKEAGVDEFIHVRVNVLECLAAFQKHFGLL